MSLTAILTLAVGCFAAQEITDYHYDAAARLSMASSSLAGSNSTVYYQYDPVGNIVLHARYTAANTNADYDGDTLPDLAELTYFSTLAQGPQDDSDGDGMNNGAEFAAGTNPTNAASVLSMDLGPVTGASTQGVVVIWQSVPGKRYDLDRSTNLVVSGAFLGFRTNILAQGDSTTVTDLTATAVGPYFYRVRLRP